MRYAATGFSFGNRLVIQRVPQTNLLPGHEWHRNCHLYCDARITGVEERGEMKKWLHNIKSRMAALTSAKTDDAAWQETAAMVYVGDIYAVLLRDRVARRLAQADSRSLDYRRDDSWPFIR